MMWSGVDILRNVEKKYGGTFKTHPVYTKQNIPPVDKI
jgi:hypothetical protein